MNTSSIILLSLCTVMGVCIGLFLGDYIQLPKWKRVVIIVFGYIVSVGGMLGLNWVENQHFGGISYFGAHFGAPVGILLACCAFRLRGDETRDMLDITAPMLSLSIMIIKTNCAIIGCCGGRVLWSTADGREVVFPSQIAECILALLISAYLLYCVRKHKHRGMVIPIFYIIYGVARFYMHLLRNTRPFIGIYPAGNIWSMVSVAIGLFCVYVRYLTISNRKNKRLKKNAYNHR